MRTSKADVMAKLAAHRCTICDSTPREGKTEESKNSRMLARASRNRNGRKPPEAQPDAAKPEGEVTGMADGDLTIKSRASSPTSSNLPTA
jgi:hypothetical protein